CSYGGCCYPFSICFSAAPFALLLAAVRGLESQPLLLWDTSQLLWLLSSLWTEVYGPNVYGLNLAMRVGSTGLFPLCGLEPIFCCYGRQPQTTAAIFWNPETMDSPLLQSTVNCLPGCMLLIFWTPHTKDLQRHICCNFIYERSISGTSSMECYPKSLCSSFLISVMEVMIDALLWGCDS
ncbi:hypothetical protein U1Q18_016350, partial [Sarracenia purpurea var. burkii]